MRLSKQDYNELIRRHPNLAPKIEVSNTHSRTIAEFKSSIGNEPLGKKQVQEVDSRPVLISVVSHRKRLCDTDNLMPKWHIDCLRYSCLIQGDEPEKATIKTSQIKCKKGEEEYTEITIDYL